MLVLSRKSQEAIAVGIPGSFERLLKVTVIDISGGRGRLGFEANNNLLVHRWEVWERVCVREPEGTAPEALPGASS